MVAVGADSSVPHLGGDRVNFVLVTEQQSCVGRIGNPTYIILDAESQRFIKGFLRVSVTLWQIKSVIYENSSS